MKKNLSAIPRLSLFVAFTILITLVVCLTGFAEAEVRTSNKNRRDRKSVEEPSNKRSGSKEIDSREIYQARDDDFLKAENFANYFRNLESEGGFEKLWKRESKDLGRQSAEFDGEADADGYGYDDDEYYHLDVKRSDGKNNANVKGSVQDDANKDQGLTGKNMGARKNLNDQDGSQSIEMLSSKDSHPAVAGSDEKMSKIKMANPLAADSSRKAPSEPLDAINMSDLKANLAVEDKAKQGKDETAAANGGGSTSDQKVAETKKTAKVNEEKDAVKLKDAKFGEDAGKKEEANVKDGKESVVSKTIKENVKSLEGNDKVEAESKNAKPSESIKVEENVEKMEGKTKEGTLVKKKEDGNAKLTKGINPDLAGSGKISQFGNGVSFLNNDLKGNGGGSSKGSAIESNEKDSASLSDKTFSFDDYQDESVRGDNFLREENEKGSYDFLGDAKDKLIDVGQKLKKNDFINLPGSFEIKDEGQDEMCKSAQSEWKEQTRPRDQQQHANYGKAMEGSFQLKYSPGELENTEYHKNFIKSLRRYKMPDENTKVLNSGDTVSSWEKNKRSGKKKRSKVKKKKSIGYDEIDNFRRLNRESSGQRKFSNSNWNPRQDSRIHTFESKAKKRSSPRLTDWQCEARNRVNRKRRKLTPKLEYEIKIINQNQQGSRDSSLMSLMRKRKKKDIRMMRSDFGNPYTRLFREDETMPKEEENVFEENKSKRKAPAWKEKDRFETSKEEAEEDNTKLRGAPMGYYTNRVKFGQKHFAFMGEENPSESADEGYTDRISSILGKKMPSETGNDYLQRSWGDVEESKHDPTKRFDENSIFGKNHQNSLLLIKKDKNGDRIATAFINGNRENSESDMNSVQLANILSKDNDYIILKKTDNKKFQKIEGQDSSRVRTALDTESSPLSSPSERESSHFNKDGSPADSNKQSRAVFIRLYRSNDQKLHNPNSKSSLKKTFEKFKDFADFFKENEQDTSESQHTAQEIKDKGEIVFSEDKIPDPIVINNEIDGKSENGKSKSPNTLSSITSSFDQLDREKKMEQLKFDDTGNTGLPNPEKSSWEPALKKAFPEAKSINSMKNNGNEIVILDFDKHHLKMEQENEQLFMPDSSGQRNPITLTIPGQRQIKFVLNEGTLPNFLEPPLKQNGEERVEPKSIFLTGDDSGYSLSVANPPENTPVITLPLNQFTQLPGLFKQYSDNKPNGANPNTNSNFKAMAKKSTDPMQEISNNFNQFLRDYRELSELNKEPITNKKIKFNKKRNSNGIPISSSYSEANAKQLEAMVRNAINGENQRIEGGGNGVETIKNGAAELATSRKWQSNPSGFGFDSLESEPRNQWTSADFNSREYVSSGEGKAANLMKSAKVGGDNVGDLSQVDESSYDDDYQDKLWKELSMASSKIQRLRREGATEKKLRQAIEEALSLKGKRWSRSHQNPSQNSRGVEKTDGRAMGRFDTINLMNGESPKDSGPAGDSNSAGKQNKIEKLKDSSPQICPKESEKSKRSFKSEKSEKSRVGNRDSGKNLEISHSDRDETNELIGSSKSVVESESKGSQRQKRSPDDDLEAKVSKPEVKNEILKKSGEDTYQSLYSPGIRRKLLSIDDENEDPNGYYNGDESNEKTKVATKTESESVNDVDKKCVDPFILDLFREDRPENKNGENRERRSLEETSSHSNYKREIDLAESMPNDFQNFLVTSLGLDSHAAGIGSQKRESVKKSRASWESRGTSEENYDQIVKNTAGEKDANGEDSASLEKRDVSHNENGKRPDHMRRRNEPEKRQSNSLDGGNRPEIESKLKEKSLVKISSDYDESKVPTQIRIQVTKASAKEKKSSKPESENDSGNSSPEMTMEMVGKKKELVEKAGFDSSMHLPANPQKLLQAQKKFTVSAEDGENGMEDSLNQRYLMMNSLRRNRRKKKKHVQENSMKPIKDFMPFDQKAVETLLRKYYIDQNQMKKGNQKAPTSNHLPQVETVYNPTQGTNKAQLQGYKPVLKMNSLSNKNLAQAKNTFHYRDASPYDEGIIRAYVKEKSTRTKAEKEDAKDFEDVKWTPFFRGPDKLSANPIPSNQPDMFSYKPYGGETSGSFEKNDDSKKAPLNQLKWYQTPYSDYMNPPPLNVYNAYAGTPKQKMTAPIWNRPNSEIPNVNNWRKFPNYLNDETVYAKDAKDKNPNTGTYQTDDAWNMFDHYDKNKKPLSDKYKFRDSFVSSWNPNWRPESMKGKYTPQKFKYLPAAYDREKFSNLDSAKDSDYSDTLEEVYVDGDELKQDPSFDSFETNWGDGKDDLGGYQNLANYRNPDWDAILGDEDEEADDDYYENGDGGSEQFSVVDDSNFLPSELSKKEIEYQKLKDYLYGDDSTYSGLNDFFLNGNEMNINGQNYRKTDFMNPKMEGSFEPGSNKIALTEIKNDADTYGSSAVLKKANEKSDIFGKNFMQSLNQLNYDNNLRMAEKLLEGKSNLRNQRAPVVSQDPQGLATVNLGYREQSEMQGSQKFRPAGSRLIYAQSESQSFANNPPSIIHYPQSRSDENVYYWLPKSNSLNAALRGPENEVEYESEQNNKNFGGNFPSGEKEGEKKEMIEENVGDGKRDSEESENTKLADSEDAKDNAENIEDNAEDVKDNAEDVKDNPEDVKDDSEDAKDNPEDVKDDSEDANDNPEDGSETLPEDNVLENVIGKYIMRKSVNVEPEQNSKNDFGDGDNIKDPDSRVHSENLDKHKRDKKSIDYDFYPGKMTNRKVWRKRLSSGHLTENNYRKYHKKNSSAKRLARNLRIKFDGGPEDATSGTDEENNLENGGKDLGKEEEEKNRFDLPWENSRGACKDAVKIKKRSALSLLRKIGGKDRVMKKEDMSENEKTEGFEPILTTADNEFETFANDRQEEDPQKEQIDQANRIFLESEMSSNEKSGIADRKKEDDKNYKNQYPNQLDEGPWKIELNEKYDDKSVPDTMARNKEIGFLNVKEEQESLAKHAQGGKGSFADAKESFAKVNERKEIFGDGGNEDIKAYLVIRKNAGAAEETRNPAAEVLSPTLGAFKREVGNNYLPKSERGEGGDSNGNLWKRSEECSASKYLPVEAAPEKPLNKPEGNRALQNGKSLSKADSKTQASRFIERNSEKNASFVSARDSSRKLSDEKQKFLSNGRLKRKSVFPLSSDASIMGDNRHVDEETSKYLGQQIVDAILAHASTNPRFKELIAPGLAGKAAPISQEATEGVKGTLNRAEYLDQVQSLLQKVMFDVEKIAEQHVRKRMCNKIDRQSKEFLHFLLEVPIQAYKDNFENSDPRSGHSLDYSKKCPSSCCETDSSSTEKTEPGSVTTEDPNCSVLAEKMSPDFDATKIRNKLLKKQNTLLKLMDDYLRLSQLEKQAINVSFQYLQSELDQTNVLLSNLEERNCCSQQMGVDPGNASEVFQARGSSAQDCVCGTKNETLGDVSEKIKSFQNVYNVSSEQVCDSNVSTTAQPPGGQIFQFEPMDKENNHESSTDKKMTTESKTESSSERQEGFETVSTVSNECIDNISTYTSFQRETSSPCTITINQSSTQDQPKEMIPLKKTEKTGKKDSNGLPIIVVSTKSLGSSDAHKSDGFQKSGTTDEAKQPADSQRTNNPGKEHRTKGVPNGGFVRSSRVENFKNPESSIASNGRDDSYDYNQGRVDKFPPELEDILLSNKKGFYPEPKPHHLYTPIQNLFKSLNNIERKKIDGSQSSVKNTGRRYNRRKRYRRRSLTRGKKLEEGSKAVSGGQTMERDSDFEENPDLEYLIWSSMPPVRRRLNDLDSDVESYRFPRYRKYESIRRKKLSRLKNEEM